jgi:hypothetical protein
MGRSTLSLYTIATLISMGGYRYTGLKELDYPLYRDRYIITCNGRWDDHTHIADALSVGDIDDDYLVHTKPPTRGLHWEFMKGGPSLGDRQYLYLPVGTYSDAVMQLVPSIPYWTITLTGTLVADSGSLLPDREYLLYSNHLDYGEWYNVGPIDMGTSPFLPGFISTGATILLGDGEVLYEYQDREGWYSPPGTLYTSPLRPSNHQYPLGRPKPGDLIYDECSLVGGYPTKAIYPWVGYSTGYRTTDSYHPTRTYYLYEDLEGGTFLHDSEPSPNSWVLIEELLGGGGITLYTSCVRDEIYIREEGCGVVISLPDLGTGRYTDGSIWGDCIWVGDNYYLAWDPCITYWSDRVWLDDLDICNTPPPQCNIPCWWNDALRLDYYYICEDS